MCRTRLPALLPLASLLLLASTAAGATTLTCESRDNAYKSCPVNASAGVRLTRQLSSQGCWQNDTWGYDADRIWVTQGCRAEFEVGAQKSSSTNNAIAAAAVVGLAAAAVVASNQHDDHHDKHYNNNYDYNRGYGNYSYGYSDYGYNNYNNNHHHDYDDRYPDNYHGRNYSSSRYGYNGYGGDPLRTFVCESPNSRIAYCSIPTRGHVEVFRQRSSSPCTHGHSWGVEGHRVWVDKGCRAEFAVY